MLDITIFKLIDVGSVPVYYIEGKFPHPLTTAFCGKIHGKDAVVVDETFLHLPRMYKDVILMHEIGHIQNGDLDERRDGLTKEFLADEYAARNCGRTRVVQTLRYYYENVVTSTKSRNNFAARLENLGAQL